MRPILRVTTVLVLSTFLAGPAATLIPVFGDDAAHARGGEGNGGGNGGGGDRGGDRDRGGEKAGGKEKGGKASAEGRSGGETKGAGKARAERTETATAEKGPKAGSHGALSSGLKGLNAAHASPQAMANAAPNSQVGRIATYKAAVEATAAADAARAELDATVAELAARQSTYDASRLSLTDAQQAEIDRLAELGGQETALGSGYAGTLADLADQENALRNDAIDDASQATELAAIDDARTLAADTYTAAKEELDAEQLAAQTERDRLQGEIEAIDTAFATDSAGYLDEIARLAEEATYDGIPPDEALAVAANGRTLTEEELAYLHDLLGLDAPATN
jgi:hypothetical protein